MIIRFLQNFYKYLYIYHEQSKAPVRNKKRHASRIEEVKHTDVFLAQLASMLTLSFSPCGHVENAKAKQ
ncbi:hypothetical protein KN10_2635 [Anoxybacillus flavithermus NBRC 109594]|uniref:Uncharacterized protein n=1 Tax=Anoxybacillus flavithermus NBRC 109594 TaxID=1315967 RepID=R4G267_9BACL|nr:hypothetical protein KN10_2635 [Anoxybacillus flavithermus NBRC 109594]